MSIVDFADRHFVGLCIFGVLALMLMHDTVVGFARAVAEGMVTQIKGDGESDEDTEE